MLIRQLSLCVLAFGSQIWIRSTYSNRVVPLIFQRVVIKGILFSTPLLDQVNTCLAGLRLVPQRVLAHDALDKWRNILVL